MAAPARRRRLEPSWLPAAPIHAWSLVHRPLCVFSYSSSSNGGSGHDHRGAARRPARASAGAGRQGAGVSSPATLPASTRPGTLGGCPQADCPACWPPTTCCCLRSASSPSVYTSNLQSRGCRRLGLEMVPSRSPTNWRRRLSCLPQPTALPAGLPSPWSASAGSAYSFQSQACGARYAYSPLRWLRRAGGSGGRHGMPPRRGFCSALLDW
jgi:hypothetical protein